MTQSTEKEERFSFSQVSTMMSCPQKFDFKYRQNRKVSKGGEGLALGAAIGEAIKHSHGKNELDIPFFFKELDEQIAKYDEFEWKQEGGVEKLQEAGTAILESYWENDFDVDVWGNEVAFEVPIKKKSGNGFYLFHGYIDQLVRREIDKNKFLVVREFKSGKNKPVPEALRRQYQLAIYSLPFLNPDGIIVDPVGREQKINVVPILNYIHLRDYISNECRIKGCDKGTNMQGRFKSKRDVGIIACSTCKARILKGNLTIDPENLKTRAELKKVDPVIEVKIKKDSLSLIEEAVADIMYAIKMGVKFRRVTWTNECGFCEYEDVCQPFLGYNPS